MSKLALGTVQFGLNYGVSNISGQTNLSEATKIIKLAEEENIDLIDTAISYGDSEKTIGKIGILDFRFVSKLPSVLNIKERLVLIDTELLDLAKLDLSIEKRRAVLKSFISKTDTLDKDIAISLQAKYGEGYVNTEKGLYITT